MLDYSDNCKGLYLRFCLPSESGNSVTLSIPAASAFSSLVFLLSARFLMNAVPKLASTTESVTYSRSKNKPLVSLTYAETAKPVFGPVSSPSVHVRRHWDYACSGHPSSLPGTTSERSAPRPSSILKLGGEAALCLSRSVRLKKFIRNMVLYADGALL